MDDIEVPIVLPRNTACHQCRKSKRKCDARKPVCSVCVRRRQPRDGPAIQEICTWDDPPSGDLFELARVPKRARETSQGATFDGTSTPSSGGPSLSADCFAPVNELSPDLFELLWPDWPRDLPNLVVVEHMVNVFFDKIPTVPLMFRRAHFLNRLQYPPSHPSFPATAVLHAMLSCAASFIPHSSLSSPTYFPVSTPATQSTHPILDFQPKPGVVPFPTANLEALSQHDEALVRFQRWHRRKALDAVTAMMENGERFVEIVQAQNIVSTADCLNGRSTEFYMQSALAVRMCTPLRLCHSITPEGAFERLPYFLLGVRPQPLEQAERDRTWWATYLLDITATSPGTCQQAIDASEITTELPVQQSTYEAGQGGLSGSQDFQTDNLYSIHPPEHAHGLALFVKATKVYAEVGSFIRISSRKAHSAQLFSRRPEVRILLSHINAFRLSLPAIARRPTDALHAGRSLDGDLLAAIMTLNAAAMLLGEPMITGEGASSDLARFALGGARAVLSLLYDITATSYDISLLPPFCTFIFYLSARILGRFIVAARESDQHDEDSQTLVFEAEINVFKMALERYGERHKIGLRYSMMIESLMAAIPPRGSFEDDLLTTNNDEAIRMPDLAGSSASSAPPSWQTTPVAISSRHDEQSATTDTDDLQRTLEATLSVDCSGDAKGLGSFATGGGTGASEKVPDMASFFDISSFSFDTDMGGGTAQT